jgi:peptidoglycan hydrolase-like amidase
VLRLKVGREERELRLGSARPLLLAESPAGWYRVAELSLLPGDKVAFLAIGSTLELLGVKRRQGRGDDRRGTNYRWTEVRDAAALEESLNKVAPVGRLKDLTIVRRGVSGRVAELSVEGAAGRAIVQGFRIRRALDLPEILFTMSLQKDDAGFIRRATFRGRGWGHGVGMCQSGAFGMALRGRDYREILAHYYPGSVLVDGP